jgi:hypothetical protein
MLGYQLEDLPPQRVHVIEIREFRTQLDLRPLGSRVAGAISSHGIAGLGGPLGLIGIRHIAPLHTIAVDVNEGRTNITIGAKGLGFS